MLEGVLDGIMWLLTVTACLTMLFVLEQVIEDIILIIVSTVEALIKWFKKHI